ncbi:hypothetical protein [Streptomyces sp. NBC_00989]|uniref:hypothetical protein n=1 Tax=Streptomyces sp. NBC_00989 TaxID=2903705 RepID=UPI002F90FEBA|nr:hypothetical protein OG714_54920 [Streptomyces sp. NBC_00989]
MEPISLLVIAYLVLKGLEGGANNVKESHDNNKKRLSPKEEGDKSRKGTNVAAGIITGATAIYTFGSGFRNGWKEASGEAREVVEAQRARNKELRDRRTVPPGDGRPPVTEADGAGVLKKDDSAAPAPGGETAPPAPKSPPAPPAPKSPPAPPAPKSPPAPPAPPAPGGGTSAGGPPMVPAPPSYPPPPTNPPSSSGPAPAGPVPSTPGSSSVTTPGSIEVVSVDTLVLWLTDAVEFANRERDDAIAAVKRISDLEIKVENAYTAAAAAKYDEETLTLLASLRELLAKLKLTREEDARSSADAQANSGIAANNVLVRHGGINEAAAAAPVDMAESRTYVD